MYPLFVLKQHFVFEVFEKTAQMVKLGKRIQVVLIVSAIAQITN